ncbi:hypothetical protein D3C86_2227730 [compost metagenome]
MQPLIKAVELGKADGANQRQTRTEKNEKGNGNGGPYREFTVFAHSITSPRIRNLERATVETKPRIAITSAASK